MFPLYKKKLKSSDMYSMIAYKRRPNHYKVDSLAPIFQSIASSGIYPNSYQLRTFKSLIGPFEVENTWFLKKKYLETNFIATGFSILPFLLLQMQLSWKLMPLLVSTSSQLNWRPREHFPPPIFTCNWRYKNYNE